MSSHRSQTRTYRPAGAATAGAEARYAPSRGRLARLLGPLHVTGVFWFRFSAFGARRAEWIKRIIVPGFTAFFWLSLWRIRQAVAQNLVPVLGPAGWLERQRRIWRTFYAFAWSLTERYERLGSDLPFAIEVESAAIWEALADSGRGFVLLTGHVGNWEMASALPVSERGLKIHVVREEELDPRAQAYIEQRLGERMGAGYTTHFAAGDPLLGLAMREALERHEVVALQGDRPRRTGGTLTVQVFGRPYQLPIGPLVLARQTASPLLPSFVYRLGRRHYRVVVHDPLRVARTADRAADLEAAAHAFVPILEAAICRSPHQWYVFRELWD